MTGTLKEFYQPEEWKPIKIAGNESGKYIISSYGRVFNTEAGVYVSQVLTGIPQYFYVNLTISTNNRILRRVHNLMLKTFDPDGEFEGASVDHIDRNKYNNALWNFRWANQREQTFNRGCTIHLDSGITLIQQLAQWEEVPSNCYGFFYPLVKEGITNPDKLFQYYLAREEYGFSWDTQYNGMFLFEWCYKNSLNFHLTRKRLQQGWDEKQLLEGYRKEDLDKGVEYEGVWYPSIKQFCKTFNINRDRFRESSTAGMSVFDIVNWDPKDAYRFHIDNHFMTKEEHCKRVGVEISAVTARCAKRGITFEESLKMKPERCVGFHIDGYWKRNSEWAEYFDVPIVSFGSAVVKSTCKREALERVGVDRRLYRTSRQ